VLRSLTRSALTLALLSGMGCTPTLFSNRSYLVSEELRLSKSNYASLKSTGETFDLSPIKAQEPGMSDRVTVLEVRGTWLLAGDGMRKVWRLWPAGKEEAKYKPVDLAPDKSQGSVFKSPTLEASGKCGLLTWQRGAGQGRAFITADGDVNEQKCPEE
jgi:hypothetical protein